MVICSKIEFYFSTEWNKIVSDKSTRSFISFYLIKEDISIGIVHPQETHFGETQQCSEEDV